MSDNLKYFANRLRERLWVKPLIICLLSILAALVAGMADEFMWEKDVALLIPEVAPDSIEDLLKITAASMLVMATFAVASMVSAYASAGTTATPRALALVIADDRSQNALSTFVGVFIFSVVALVALKNSFYQPAGLLVLFILTSGSLALVIVTFLRWVNSIARLGRIGNVIDKVESATMEALLQCCRQPSQGRPMDTVTGLMEDPLYATEIGYIQRIDMQYLQTMATQYGLHITLTLIPGNFVSPERPVAFITKIQSSEINYKNAHLLKAFVIGHNRVFDEDPRFGIIVLSEIASRALSPAVNDPGTAIVVIGSMVRLFLRYGAARSKQAEQKNMEIYDRLWVAELSIQDLLDDAFIPITRDGAGFLEVQLRLQKALATISAGGDDTFKQAAHRHAVRALEQAKNALQLPEDIAAVTSSGLLKQV